MKIQDAVIDFKDTGCIEIDIGKMIEAFDKKTFISRWHDKYKLIRKTHKRNITFKAQIKKEDAEKIIKALILQNNQSDVFKNASTYSLLTGI